jgi:hypothetical protein
MFVRVPGPQEGRVATFFDVCSNEQAQRALEALGCLDPDSQVVPRVRFDSWPRIVITVPEGIDLVQAARAVLEIQDVVRRHFCFLKYGTPNLTRLKQADKERTKFTVEYPDPMRMVIDLSQPANAAAQLVRTQFHFDRVRQHQQIAMPQKGS